MAGNVSHFTSDGIGVQANLNAANRLQRQIPPHILPIIIADSANFIATLNTQRNQSQPKVAHIFI